MGIVTRIGKNFDNHDLWTAFLEEVHKRPNCNITFVKVRAHVSRGYTGQPEYWTRGNELADRYAKRKAREAFLKNLQELKPFIHRAVDIQSHAV